MEDQHAWLALARAPNLHAGHLARAGSPPATPQDLLAILQAIKAAGALNAELEVI